MPWNATPSGTDPLPDRASTDGQEKRRRKRSTGEIRSLAVEAARELFCTRGFAGTSTREIAARADVSETLLFRHFGTKAALFEEAVLRPFLDVIVSFVTQWRQDQTRIGSSQAENVEEAGREFIGGFFHLFRENRDLLMAVLNVHAYEMGPDEAPSPIGPLCDVIDDFAREIFDELGLRDVEPLIPSRVAVGAVIGMALLDDWLYPPGRHPTPERIVEEATAHLIYGFGGLPRRTGQLKVVGSDPAPATAKGRGPSSALVVTRKVSGKGTICIDNQFLPVGREHSGKIAEITVHPRTFQVSVEGRNVVNVRRARQGEIRNRAAQRQNTESGSRASSGQS